VKTDISATSLTPGPSLSLSAKASISDPRMGETNNANNNIAAKKISTNNSEGLGGWIPGVSMWLLERLEPALVRHRLPGLFEGGGLFTE
jgi:hypothetical protein